MVTRRQIRIDQATEEDIPLILSFIHEFSPIRRALNRVSATEESLRVTLFGPRPYAEAVIAREHGEAVAFALYYFSYASFLV